MRAIFLIAFLFSSVAFGRGTPPRALAANTLSDGNWSGTNSIYLKITPYQQGVGFGVNYEKVLANNFGAGGSINILPEKTNSTPAAVGLTSIMGNLYVHFPVDIVDFYVSPALGMMMMELGSEDKTSLGAAMTFGTVVQVNKSFAAGLEMSAHQPWFNKEFFVASRAYFFNSNITARFTF